MSALGRHPARLFAPDGYTKYMHPRVAFLHYKGKRAQMQAKAEKNGGEGQDAESPAFIAESGAGKRGNQPTRAMYLSASVFAAMAAVQAAVMAVLAAVIAVVTSVAFCSAMLWSSCWVIWPRRRLVRLMA